MIPEQRTTLANVEFCAPDASWLNWLMRSAICARWQVKAMPMNRRGLRKSAANIHLHGVAIVHFERWPKKWLIDPDRGCVHAFEEARGTFLQI